MAQQKVRIKAPANPQPVNNGGPDIREILRNPLLLPSEVAILLRLPLREVQKLARYGILPSVMVGDHRRFLKRDILLFLTEQRNHGREDPHPESEDEHEDQSPAD